MCADKAIHYQTGLEAGCLNWGIWVGLGGGSNAHQEKFVWKLPCVFRFDQEEMGRGCGIAARGRGGLLMKFRGRVSQTAGTGPDLQARLHLHLSLLSSLDLGISC